jgi:hypothetical protein
MTDWQEVVMPESQPFLPSDDPIVQALGQPGERFLPPVDVVDWWEHSDPEARLSPTGIAGAQRQLIITTARVIVMKDGSLDRSFPIKAVAGAELRDPLDGRNEGSEKAVLVKSPSGEQEQVLGMWSMAPEQAHDVMNSIFKFSHGLS